MAEQRSKTWLSRISIRWIAPIVFMLPVIAVTAALTVIAMRTNQQASTDLALQSLQQIHARIIERLDYLMDSTTSMEATYTDLFEEGLLQWNALPDARPAIYRMLRAFPHVSSTVLGSEQGDSLMIVRYPGEPNYEMAVTDGQTHRERTYQLNDQGETTGTPIESQYDPRIRPWYKAALTADGPTWGPVYVWVRNGEPATLGVSYVSAFHEPVSGVLRGVICSEITLADISKFMASIEVGKTGRAYVMDNQGHLLASSNPQGELFDGTEMIDAANANDPLIAESAAFLKKHFPDLSKVRTTDLEPFTTKAGLRCHLEISPYTHGQGLNWLVVTVVPDEDFLSHIRATRNRSVLLGAAVTIFALGLGFALALAIVRPVIQLSRQVHEIGDGNLENHVDVSAGREMTQLSNALNRMIDALKDRLRLMQSLNLAMEVQQSLLPSDTPTIEGVEIAAHSTYCDETGGDYYDFLDVTEVDKSHAAVVVGDVMGHGVAAAMFMATARGVLRSRARIPGSLAELLTHVNELLVDDTKGTRFMTMVLMLVDGVDHRFRWAAAGHDPPIIYEPAKQAFREPADIGGLPLGIMEAETYQEGCETSLDPGTVMLIGTDGLWEAQNSEGVQYGKARLHDLVREHADRSATEMLQIILDDHARYLGGQNQDDDVTFVVLKFQG